MLLVKHEALREGLMRILGHFTAGKRATHMHISLIAMAAAAALAAALPSAAPAMAAGDAAAGYDLAQRWCSSCHVVDRTGQGTDAAPPFVSIAQRGGSDRTWVRAWLASPHPPMPNLDLSQQQVENVIAYLASLAPF